MAGRRDFLALLAAPLAALAVTRRRLRLTTAAGARLARSVPPDGDYTALVNLRLDRWYTVGMVRRGDRLDVHVGDLNPGG